MTAAALKIVGMIPARMGSSRFPGKPLAPILGHSMIEHVYRRTSMCTALSDVFIATCDREIFDAVEAFGGKAIMTSASHQRASDRIAEASADLNADIVVMVQGDEPMTHPEMIQQSLAPFNGADEHIVCVNLVARIKTEEEFEDRNTIKVALDNEYFALYMSREPIPTRHLQDFKRIAAFKQVCIIPFTNSGLKLFTRLPPTKLEQVESIDMLRFIEHGYKVKMVETAFSTHAVDTPADLKLVEQLMATDPLIRNYITNI